MFIGLLVLACNKDEDNLYSFDYLGAPTKVSALFDITQDNTGLVTIVPSAEGAQKYNISFGDSINETPTSYNVGTQITHYYTEGLFTVKVAAVGITGLSTVFTQEINVSFQKPENLVLDVQNDPVVSNKVNITATADYASVFEILFGDVQDEVPTLVLPDKVVSHVYPAAGVYTITVVAKGGAIATLDSTFMFETKEITIPTQGAPVPPARASSSVVSIFSDTYNNVPNSDYNPDWGQATQATIEDFGGNSTLKYATLNYQGTQFGSAVDATFMEYLHIDMWTVDATEVNAFIVSFASGEKSVSLPIEAGVWKSYDIPMSDFTSQGLDVSDLVQFKFVGSNGSTIYLDNLYFYKEGTSGLPVFPLDFESAAIDYTFTDFDGGNASIVGNPQATGINTSSKVVQMIKSGGKVWGGSFISMAEPIDFSVNKTFKMKVYAPKVGTKVLLKVENVDNGAISFEKEVVTTLANAWEELTFDYSAINTSESYQNVVIIFDLGTVGDGTPNFTYLFDDINLGNGTSVETGNLALPLSFESTTLDYSYTDFDGGAVSVVSNTQVSGINTSATVGKMIKNAGKTWGGSYIQLSAPIDFSTKKTFKLKVFSPRVGAKVLLKVENATEATINFEKEVTTTVANAWETLTFDYAAIDASKSYQKIILIFDKGIMGDGSANYTFLFDDIELTN